MHHHVLLTVALAATGALAGPLKRDTTSTATWACNPAHAYPDGAHCVSSSGTLTLVTPTASSSTKACKTTHKVTAAAAASSKATTTAAASSSKVTSSTSKACKATSKATTSAAASSKAASSAAQSAASAVSTKGASSGETKVDGLTWTVENLTRHCTDDKTECDYKFGLTSSDHKVSQTCDIVRKDVKNAPVESWSNIACNKNSPIKVSWGYSDQFGADNAFATMVVVDDKEIAYFGVPNLNSKGSGQYGNIGPQPVYKL